uniref:Kinesin motor domain-containing protein n=1 Tax=Pelodiscus sinensis TaxID=13735 RepID=K7FG30_PELSI
KQGVSIVPFSHRLPCLSLSARFDTCYEEEATQHDIYSGSVQPVLRYLLEGQNASVLAYGPTGAGKTHTMLGSPEQPGVIPRALRDVLQMTREASCSPEGEAWDYSVSMSYLEIYQEKVLGEREVAAGPFSPIPTSRGSIHCHWQRPPSQPRSWERRPGPPLQLYNQGCARLSDQSAYTQTSSTVKRAPSQQRAPSQPASGLLLRWDWLLGEGGPSPEHPHPGASNAINPSLLTLSKVVDALDQGLPRVPYRDSKLTRLLQDSLGGSAHSVIIANVAPEQHFYFDTLRTLNFAAKSKQVVNRPFTQESLPGPGEPHVPGP